MTDFCIQIQPERASDLDLDGVMRRAGLFAEAASYVTRFSVVTGDDYVNLMFETDAPSRFWHAFVAEFFGADRDGLGMTRCCIATCQGDLGWDDYRLLHHFDAEQPRDGFV
jgi:hypothetical protein